jgi:dipeptidyl aminopeptidase/acylaminoacyl peptidase
MIALRGAAVLLALIFSATPLFARPFTVEDMLKAERFGDVIVDPSGRWLVYAIERPLAEAPRFDIEAMDAIRSRLFLVDLAHPGEGRALVPGGGQAGMVAYGFSPKGTRIAIARLTGVRWQLGIVMIATGAVTWFDVSPAYDRFAGTWCWLSEGRLVLIAGPDGPPPFGMRANAQMITDLADAWRRARAGREASVTVVGSGRYLSITPHVQNQRLLLIDADTGAIKILARGDLTSVTVSPDGRTFALAEQADGVAFPTDQLLEIGFESRRQRLSIIDTASGRRWVPCGDCDLLTSAPAWRADGKALLFAAHRDGESVASATVWRADLSRRRARAVDARGVQPVVSGPPNASAGLSYGWRGATPLLFARSRGAATKAGDWYQLRQRRATCLTCTLALPGTQLVPDRGRDPFIMSDSGVWRLSAMGAKAVIADMDGTMALPAGEDQR